VTARPLHVLIVDDSAVVREGMSAVLTRGSGLTIATAADPVIARRKIAALRPDVIVLDLEMPREDGLTFLREQMARDPIPVVICSSHSTHGSRVALEALREGAVDVVAKPRLGVREFVHESATLLLDAIHAAAGARLTARRVPDTTNDVRRESCVVRRGSEAGAVTSRSIIAIAASTGGPQALQEVLADLPPDMPGIVVVQHMPAGFTTAFARHLNSVCRIEVKEAESGDRILDGRALIAPGGQHLHVRRDGSGPGFVAEVASGPLVSRHRPSADVLFHSVAVAAGARAIGVIMTGMGSDGAAGLRAMHDAGATTLAQNEASCVVFGMPKEAIACGAVDEVLPLSSLGGGIVGRIQAKAR